MNSSREWRRAFERSIKDIDLESKRDQRTPEARRRQRQSEMAKRAREEEKAKMYKQMTVAKRQRGGLGSISDFNKQISSNSAMSRSSSVPGEYKYHDTSSPSTWQLITSGGQLLKDTFNGMAQGAGEQQRIGKNIFVKSLHVKCVIRAALGLLDTGTNASRVVRIMILRDTNCKGTALQGTDILENTPASVHPTYFRNLDNTTRVNTLRDDQFALNQKGVVNVATDTVNLLEKKVYREYNFNNLNTRVTFNNTTGDISNIVDNNFAMFAWVDEDSTIAPCQISWTARVRYSDR